MNGMPITYCEDAYGCVAGADALVVVTEWPLFRELDLRRVRSLMAGDAMIDLRNLFDPRTVKAHGFRYASVGRPSP
jgi:UDPglucose 6-dehydrogenase